LFNPIALWIDFVGPPYEVRSDCLRNSATGTALSLNVKISGRRFYVRLLGINGNNKRERFILRPHNRICLGAVGTFHIHFDFMLPVDRVVRSVQNPEILPTAHAFIAFFHPTFILNHKHRTLVLVTPYI